VTESCDVGGPFQLYVPGNGHGSLPGTISTNVFTFRATVCEVASLDPTGFIPGSPRSDSHAILKNSPKHRDGDSGSKVCKRCHLAACWGETQHHSTPSAYSPLSPTPFLGVLLMNTWKSLCLLGSIWQKSKQVLLSLFVFKHRSSHPLPLPLRHWPPGRAEVHPRDGSTNNAKERWGENKEPFSPVKSLSWKRESIPTQSRYGD